MLDRQLINQLLINLLFAALQVQVSHLVICCSGPLDSHFTLHERLAATLGVSGETLKLIEISRSIQYTNKSSNWVPKTPKSVQNEVQTGT